MKTNIQTFFDSVASKWDSMETKDPSYVFSLLKKTKINEKDKILDVGCGTGIITGMIHDITTIDVVGIDISSNMIKLAKAKYNNKKWANFICDDFTKHQFNEQFDKIIIYNAYPHFLDVKSLSKKAFEILNRDGCLIILHSLSKEELKMHHENIPLISRDIKSPKEEYRHFMNEYYLDEYFEDEHSYYMCLKRK